MWTNAQIAAFQRVVAAGQKYWPIIDQFELIAQQAPQFAERVAELRTRYEMATTLAKAALVAHNNLAH